MRNLELTPINSKLDVNPVDLEACCQLLLTEMNDNRLMAEFILGSKAPLLIKLHCLMEAVGRWSCDEPLHLWVYEYIQQTYCHSCDYDTTPDRSLTKRWDEQAKVISDYFTECLKQFTVSPVSMILRFTDVLAACPRWFEGENTGYRKVPFDREQQSFACMLATLYTWEEEHE